MGRQSRTIGWHWHSYTEVMSGLGGHQAQCGMTGCREEGASIHIALCEYRHPVNMYVLTLMDGDIHGTQQGEDSHLPEMVTAGDRILGHRQRRVTVIRLEKGGTHQVREDGEKDNEELGEMGQRVYIATATVG